MGLSYLQAFSLIGVFRMVEFEPGNIYGIVDNGVLIFGAYTGLEVEKLIPSRVAGMGAVWGAALGNTISDGLGALLDPSLSHMAGGIVLGCLIPCALIPLLSRFMKAKTA
jgi:hypothetical protein